MMQYTEEEHAERLVSMLEQIARVGHLKFDLCPADMDDDPDDVPWDNNYCKVCRDFIDLTETKPIEFKSIPATKIKPILLKCPCLVLGTEEALARTEKAVDEFFFNDGYTEEE
jgi:hypothetical protein